MCDFAGEEVWDQGGLFGGGGVGLEGEHFCGSGVVCIVGRQVR